MNRILKEQRGSSLVLVLLIVLVFSVLGLSILSSTIGEKKRTVNTESNSQAQQYALDGLTYFETDYKHKVRVAGNDFLSEYLYPDGEKFSANIEDHTLLSAQFDILANEVLVKVESKGFTDPSASNSLEKTIKDYYRPFYRFDEDEKILEIKNFINQEVLVVNFSHISLLNLELLGTLLNLEVLNISNPKELYRVPDNGSFIGNNKNIAKVDLLELLGIQLSGRTGNFTAFENNAVIATKESSIIEANLLADLVTINTLKSTDYNVNVLIDGGYEAGHIVVKTSTLRKILGPLGYLIEKLLGSIEKLLEHLHLDELLNVLGVQLTDSLDFKNINFQKLAVLGNVVINVDESDPAKTNSNPSDQRRFSFTEGLFVNKTLLIGSGDSNGLDNKLLLSGDMLTNEELIIKNIELNIAEKTNIYVFGDATIDTAHINLPTDSDQFGLFIKGTLTINNNHPSRSFDGMYYAENGIVIETNNEDITINGGLFGEVTVNGSGKVEVNWDEKYLPDLKIKYLDLLPQGRLVD